MGIINNVKKYFLGNSVAGGLWGWLAPGDWNKRTLLAQYTRYVYTVVSAIAMDSAKVGLEVIKYAKDGTVLPVVNHPFLDLIKMPNEDQSQFQFLELHFTYMKLMGESFWYFPIGATTQKPKEIYLLRPDRMEVAVDPNDPSGRVKGYVMHKDDATKVTFEKEEIVHFKMPNPVNPYRGLGAVEAAKVYIETEEYASNWTKNSLYNSGRPSGVLTIKGTIGVDEFNGLKRQFKDNYSGSQNAGKTMIIKGADGMDYQKLGMELGEVALQELKNMTRDDIMVMFRVSKTLLGITDDVNRASAMESRQVFIQNIIKPEVDRFMDHINAFVMPRWGKDGATLSYEDMTMTSDADKLAEWIAGAGKWLTPNDIREERGLEPIEGGDELMISALLVPLKDAVLPPEPQPTVTPTTQDPNAEPKGLKKKEITEERKKFRERGEVFRQLLFRHQARWELKYRSVIKKEFLKQKEEILSKTKGFRKKDLEHWLFNKNESKARLVKFLYPLGINLMIEQSKWAFEMAGDDETQFVVDREVQLYITHRIIKLAESTNDVTILKIRKTIGDGIAAGESISKLQARIQQVYSNASSIRSELIARTETIASSNAAANEAYRQSPLVIRKEWAANPDACEFCAELDGKTVGLDEDYVTLGQHITGTEGGVLPINYEDIGFPPAHPRCRCTILPVAAD